MSDSVNETAPVRRNYENANHESVLCDTDSFEQWTEGGSLDMQQRANTRWKQMLADYDEPLLDAAIDRAARIHRRPQGLDTRRLVLNASTVSVRDPGGDRKRN